MRNGRTNQAKLWGLGPACALGALAITALTVFSANDPAHASECAIDKPRAEMTYEDAQTVWECLKDGLHAGYIKGPKRWIPDAYVQNYRNWKLASTLPADPGFHGGRFLLTYVNEIGYSEYTRFADDGSTDMPAGSVIAKESFTVGEDGKARPGPLFLMQRAAAGASPKTNDWFYMMVMPTGAPAAINVYSACNECHMGFEHQGNLGYPVEEARVGQ